MRILLVLFSFLLSALAAPSVVRSSRIRRQNPAPFNGPITVTTTSNIPTSIGTITQTCQVTLTPVTVNGVNAVREDKVCKNVLDPSGSNNNNNNNNNNGGGGGGNNENTSSSSSSSSSTTTSAASEASSTSSSGSNNNNNNNNGATGNIVNPTDVAVIGTSVVGSGAATAGSSTATSGAGSGPVVIGQSSIATATASAGTGGASAAADNNGTGTSAAESQASSAAPFQIPGKKLQVLPIGLGVFAGISVIALIVVGLVTYERTKYRKTFRQRKLAESGAPMGYGGMAERT